MDVGGWLRGLDLGKYEAAFRDNGIDERVLPHLTVEDLKELGVASVGDRRKLLTAIGALSSPTPSEQVASPRPSPAPAKKVSEVSAERRPITVMFCDLVGSTALASRLDAEDWRSLVNAYLDEASGAVTGLGGYVLKRLGDGLMALFGYPDAQENDAERAVRAALAIQRALADLNARNATTKAPALAARVGLDSGLVVVDATGEVFGEAPNVAARVQALAEAGAVLVTAAVQRQTAGLFVAEDRGAHELKGMPTPVTLYRIVRASGGRRGGARTLTPLVGREHELEHLSRRWERALKGEGQLVLVVGEPGIGKSRLIGEFRARLAETPHTFVEWSSSQLLQNTPLHPILEWGRQRFGAEESAERRLADLDDTLGLIGLDATEYAPLIAPLVDVPLPEDRAAKFAPEELRRRQLAAMTTWVLAGARSQPVVVAFEDLHWADPTSLDLIRALAEHGVEAPLFIVATTRPEFRPRWSTRSHHSVISLSPLDRANVTLMVTELTSRHALSKEVVEGVSERTGGVPLFVEEVTRLLVERGEVGGLQAIPPTLQQSLAARLDRLGEAREIARIGAVLGRDFTYALLRAVGGVDDLTLQPALDRLAGADLLVADGVGPQANYRFKHALIQDAAYDSLLKSRRQALHRCAAEILRDDRDRAAAAPEIIAHHFTQAGLDDLAVEWWGKAGDQALRRSAFQEAIAHLGKAIEMADKAGGQEAGVSGQRLHMRVAYGNALMAAHGHGAPETTAAFAHAHDTALSDKDAPERFAAIYGLWVGCYVRGDLTGMREHAADFLREVEACPEVPEAGVAHRLTGVTQWIQGDFDGARGHCEQALATFDLDRDGDLAFRFGQDLSVAAMSYLALALWPLGEVDRALDLFECVKSRIAETAHIGTVAYGSAHAILFEMLRGDFVRVAPVAAALSFLAREHHLRFWLAYGVFSQGWARWQMGERAAGLAQMRSGVAQLREQNAVNFDALLKGLLARAEAQDGDFDAASTTLDTAFATSERTGQHWFDAELQRTRGEILLRRNRAHPAPAEQAFLAALDIARGQKACSFALRAALSLAKLYQSVGRAIEAYDALAPALEGFSPTPGMPEIAEAQALLAALAETGEVKNAAASRQRRLQLQTNYSKALMLSEGFASEEAKAAFARAQELAKRVDSAVERFDNYFGQWAGSMLRGEMQLGREFAEKFLREAEKEGRTTEAAAARRCLGATCLFQGDLAAARVHLEQAIRILDPERDREAKFRFGTDVGALAAVYLALTNWLLGEAGPARKLAEEAIERAIESAHSPTLANVSWFKALFDAFRDDAEAARSAAESVLEVSRRHGLALFLAFGALSSGWAHTRLGDRVTGMAELRQALAAYAEHGNKLYAPFFQGLLAELEAEDLSDVVPLARIDEALALAEQTDQRWTDALLHRIRGDILLKVHPDEPGPAEGAYLAAIAIAQRQKARSLELRAALSLAKLYQSTARPVDAHTVLAPALAGFSPTPEMPGITEARALLAALAETDEVKNAAASRQRRLELQTSYSKALMFSRGYGSEEAMAAFARAQALATGVDSVAERFDAYYGQFIGNLTRGELRLARETAEIFLFEAEKEQRATEAAAAHRNLGAACLFQGDLAAARAHLEQALRMFDPERDREAKFRFNADIGTSATVFLALTNWLLGEAGPARKLIEEASARAVESAHAPTLAVAYRHKALFEALRDDAEAGRRAAESLLEVSREHGLRLFLDFGAMLCAWARARLGDRESGMTELRQALAESADQGIKLQVPVFQARLAEFEAAGQGAEGAATRIDEALALAEQTDQRWTDAFLHRIRGDILLKVDPKNPVRAENAYRTAVAIARGQGARSFGLQAALKLAKLCQSTGRCTEAHAVLAPALQGFSPTQEMPEIAEAQALLEDLA